jgi:hypothetical protein
MGITLVDTPYVGPENQTIPTTVLSKGGCPKVMVNITTTTPTTKTTTTNRTTTLSEGDSQRAIKR